MEGRPYKNNTKAQETRALRTHRRSIDQKASRLDYANKRRNLNLLEPLDEHESQTRRTTQNTAETKKGKDPMERLEQLKKWKEQKMLKQKIESRNKKPVFKVSIAKPVEKPFSKGGAQPPKINSQPAAKPQSRPLKTTVTKKPAEAPAPSRRVTRSSVASESTATRSTAPKRYSVDNSRTTTVRATTAVKPATKTTAKPPPTMRSSRISSTSSRASTKPAKAQSPPKKSVKRSTRTSVRSESTADDDLKVNTRHVTRRSDIQEEDELIFQYAKNNFVFEFQPMESASILFPEEGESVSSPRTKRSARLSSKDLKLTENVSSSDNDMDQKPTVSSQKEDSHEEEEEMPNEVFNDEPKKPETIEREETEVTEDVEQSEEQPMDVQNHVEKADDDVGDNDRTRKYQEIATPKSVPRTTRKSCGDSLLKTPNQNAPMSAIKQRRSMSVPVKSTPNDRKVGFKMPATTPSELNLSKRMRSKDLRRSTALRGLSPEECVIVLSHSPMIEMERRPYKAARSPVAQLDFNEDEIEAMIKEQEVEKITSSTGSVTETNKKPESIPEPTLVHDEKPTENADKPTSEVIDTATVSEKSQKPPEKQVTPSESEQTSSENLPVHDVPHFRNLLVSETERLNIFSDKWNKINEETANISDEVRGQIRTTVGQAQLLIAQRFKQFSGLIDNCEFKLGEKETTCTDLVGFWEMIYIQVEDVDMKFNKLNKLKKNNWKEDKPVVRKKVLKKNPAATNGTKGPAKPLARSKFAEFRAKMMQQKKTGSEISQEEEKPEEEKVEKEVKMVTEEQPLISKEDDTKTFDAGFFKVCSPVQSPKFHCEGGTPFNSGRKSLRGRSSPAPASGSPMLKSVLDKSTRRMSRSNPNSPISGANISMRISRSNPGSPMQIAKNAVDLSSVVTSLRQEVLTKQLTSSYGPSIFSPDTQTPQSLTSIRRSSRRMTLNQSVEATSSPANRRSVTKSQRNTPAPQENCDVDFMAYLVPSSTGRPSESLSSMEAEDGPQASPQVNDVALHQGSPQVQDVDMAPPSKVSLTEEFLNMPSSAGKVQKTRSARLPSGGRSRSHSERRKSKTSAAKRQSVRFMSSSTSEDTSPLARMPLTPFNRDYPGPNVVSPPQEEEVFLFTPPTTENITPRRGSTTPATRMSKLSFKSPAVKGSSAAPGIFTPRRSTRKSVVGPNDLMTFS